MSPREAAADTAFAAAIMLDLAAELVPGAAPQFSDVREQLVRVSSELD